MAATIEQSAASLPRVGSDPMRPGWRASCLLLLIGLAALAIGQGLYGSDAATGSGAPFPSPADLWYFGGYSLCIVAILLLPLGPKRALLRGRHLFDSLLTMASITTLSWYFVFGPILLADPGPGWQSPTTILPPLFHLLGVFALLLVTGPSDAGRLGFWRNLVPGAGVVACCALWVYVDVGVNTDSTREEGVEIGCAITIFLVLLRQAFTIAQNRRLHRETLGAMEQLNAAYQSIQESEARFRAMADHCPMQVWTLDAAGRCTWVNKASLEFAGRPTGPILETGAEIIHPDDRQRAIETFGAAFEKRQSISCEYRLRRFDGEFRWLYLTAAPRYLPDGEFAGYIGSSLDITDRRLAEQALQQSEERFRMAVQSSGDAIFDWRLPTNNLIWFNDIGVWLGYQPGEFPVDIERWKTLLHPDDRERVLRELDDHLERNEPFCTEYRVIARDGSAVHFAARGSVVRDAQGRATRMIGAITDVTIRRRAEAGMQAAKEAAEAASQAKSVFLANMSHEIRTPMTAILGYADLLLDPELGAADHRDCIDTIRRNGEHLLAVINDVLDLSKVEAGKLVVDRVPCSPSEILRDLATLMEPRARDKGLDFRLQLDGTLPEAIQTDPMRLRQVLLNLVANAIKFTERGGVQVRASAVPGSTRLRIDVVDTGIGMSFDQQARLFEPFTQADSSTTRRFGGTGLGLNISQSLTRLLGGEISFISTPGRGSTFSVTIDGGASGKRVGLRPADPSSSPRQPAPEPLATPPATPSGDLLGARILLAEDGPDNQRLIVHFLRKHGADVTLAPNGADAVDRALAARRAGRPFDLILMDMQMPELDGYQATRTLRQAGLDSPVVALTAHAMEGDREKCLAAGCDDFATKPLDRAGLLHTLRQHLARTRPHPTAAA